MIGRRRSTLALAGGIALVLLALGVRQIEADDRAREAPFVTHAAVGERATTRELEVRVVSAQFADVVAGPEWVGHTEGVWLVVELDAAAVRERRGMAASVIVGDRDWIASNRPSSSVLTGSRVDADLPRRGVILFELPADISEDPAAPSAVLRLSDRPDARLNAVIDVTIDLADLDAVGRATFSEPERTSW